MGVHIRWVDFTGLYITLPTRHAGAANSMQYLVLLPSLALVDHGKLFVQSHAHMIGKDGAHAERYPNDIQIFPKALRLTSWSQNRMLVVCRSDGQKFCALAGNILN